MRLSQVVGGRHFLFCAEAPHRVYSRLAPSRVLVGCSITVTAEIPETARNHSSSHVQQNTVTGHLMPTSKSSELQERVPRDELSQPDQF